MSGQDVYACRRGIVCVSEQDVYGCRRGIVCVC